MAVLAALVAAGCASAPAKRIQAPRDRVRAEDDTSKVARLRNDLQDDILTSYDRDEPPEIDSGMIDPKIGTARIGAGPDDAYIAGDLAHAPSRWPLALDGATRSDVRSKRLEIQLSVDQATAWMSDEVSWRISTCGRAAAIPLRITALYAHDGDRWIPVVEHLSFGWALAPLDAPVARAIKSEVASGDLRDELSGVVGRALLRSPHDASVVSPDASALVLGPDAGDEWHGARVLEAALPAGTLEDRRVGLVGRDAASATVAYWVGTYNADVPARGSVPAGKVKLRASFVFERRWFDDGATSPSEASCYLSESERRDDAKRARFAKHCRWVLAQSHVSQPISDEELARRVFGTALTTLKPLGFACSDPIPGAAPRRGGPIPPAARSP